MDGREIGGRVGYGFTASNKPADGIASVFFLLGVSGHIVGRWFAVGLNFDALKVRDHIRVRRWQDGDGVLSRSVALDKLPTVANFAGDKLAVLRVDREDDCFHIVGRWLTVIECSALRHKGKGKVSFCF